MSLQTAVCALLLLAEAAGAQTFGNASLNGKFFFRHLLYSTDSSGNLSDIRSLLGTMVFNGSGQYSVSGQQAIGSSAAFGFSSNGTYTVATAGFVSLSNPQSPSLSINARLGAEAIIGSTTEASATTFDLFVAIPAPTTTQGLGAVNGNYFVTTFELPGATAAAPRDSIFTLQANGAGSAGAFNAVGHAAEINGGTQTNQAIGGASYSILQDGTGTISFPFTGGNALVSGTKNLFVSQSGNVILGGSGINGGQDFLIGVRAFSGTASNASWTDKFWVAGIAYDLNRTTAASGSYVGSANAIAPTGKLAFTRRLHETAFGGTVDFTGVNNFTLNADGSGKTDTEQVGLGTGGNLFVTSDINSTQLDSSLYEIDFGIRMPSVSGTGVFLNPQGVANGGSFALAGAAVAPGEFITLFGSGLASQTLVAKTPYPTTLGGVMVTVNNVPAPIYEVSAGQLNILVPYLVTGNSASIVVNNSGAMSNTVVVPLAATAPGIFSLDQTGTGFGAISHQDFSLVNASNPARRGETVLIYLTGLGAVTPAVADGTAGGSNPLSKVNGQVVVGIAGKQATVTFAGLAPGFPGLYQINATVPLDLSVTGTLPVEIVTTEGFHDQVDIAVR